MFWYRNNGSGHFSDRIDIKTEDTGDWSYQVPADFDGDGDVDILNEADYYTFLFRNDGQGNFTQDTVINIVPGDINPVDLDSDGDLDIAVQLWPWMYWDSQPRVSIYINNGQGHFSDGGGITGIPYQWGDEPDQISDKGFFGYVLADFDNDGDVDLLGNSNGVLLLVLNDGTGHFTTKKRLSSAGNPLAAQDFNGDGWIDVLLHDKYLGINQGNGDFVFKKLNIENNSILAPFIGDFNGDRSIDIVYFSFTSDHKSFLVIAYLNDGQGNFSSKTNNQSFQAQYFSGISYLADLDNDGDLDLGADNKIFFNQNLNTDACSASGTILREYWAKVNGNQTVDAPVNKVPTSTSYLTSFEGPTGVGENYASRIRGYLCAPETGNYTFWIASDDYGDLYLSSDDNPANKQLIAWIKGWSNPRQFNKHYSQKSALIYLEKGKRYYIEALHKQAWVNDNLAVAWRIPSALSYSSPVVIPGSVLSPFVPANAREDFEVPNAEESAGLNLQAAPNPFNSQTTVTFTAGESGQAVLDLYDLRGQRVQSVFNAQVQAGEPHQAVVKGGQLTQGLYLLRLVNGSQVSHLKVAVTQ